MLGNVTRNPEIRYIPGSNTAVAKFGLAITRKYKQNNETKDETCFIDIVAFGRTAEFTGEYVTKGMPVLVEGRLSYNTWEQEGVRRSKHEIVAENIQLVERKSSSSSYSESNATYSGQNTVNEESDGISEDDIPF
jgi:single-strand DNA-binding protein